VHPTFRRPGRRCDAPGPRPSASRRFWSDREGRPRRFQLQGATEALQQSFQLIDGCLVGSGRRSSRMSVVGARTSCRQSCIYADRLSDRFVTASDASGDARPGSRDPSRHRLGPPSFHPSQRERSACGWSLLSEGLGRRPRRASSGFHPKRQTPFRVKQEREDGVAFSAPEKPPDACTPAARRQGRVAAQCRATTPAEAKR
jgi:hypothetical protein